MSKAILTFAYGEDFCNSQDYKVFLKSCEKIDAELVIVKPTIPIKSILRDRHFCFFEHLSKHKYDKCLICDSRDVIIQADPFILDEDFVLVSEGMTHSQSPWNMGDQFHFQRNLLDFHIDKQKDPVINGGVIYGNSDRLKDFCFLVWSNCLKSGSTDQAVINYLSTFLKPHIPDYDFCITGEGIKEGFVSVQEIDGCYYSNGKLCRIFHQWDRTIFAENVREKFKI